MHVNRQDARSRRTRRALEREGRRLFETHGYEGVAAETIVKAAGVTRGALYHHYDGKAGLFAAVVETAMQELHAAIVERTRDATHPIAGLRTGVRAFLALTEDRALQRLLFVDAPGVLGWSRWREMDARYGLGLLQRALAAIRGDRSAGPEIAAGRLLLSACIEAAMILATSDDPSRRPRVEGELLSLLDGVVTTLTST